MVNNPTNKETKKKSLNIKGFLSINDLKDKEYNNLELNHNERLALKNFDRYRINELNSQTNERDFQSRYLQLQAMANLTPYEEFLQEKYF